MLAKDGQADAQAQSGAAARSLRGKEGIEKPRQYLATDPDAIILKCRHDALAHAGKPDTESAEFANFTYRLLRVGDKVQEQLCQLACIAENRRQIGLRNKINGDTVGAQRMLMKLQAALHEFAQLHA